MKKVYLDYNATTPVLESVKEAMSPFLSDNFGNPSSIHWAGRTARKAVDDAREIIADALGVLPEEIVFTSSGTEANNLAIFGVVANAPPSKRHIITTPVEHSSVLNLLAYLEKKGFRITKLKVDSMGRIDLEEFRSALTEDTFLVSLMHANNEIGNIYPVEEIGKILSGRGVIFHCDAVQSFGKIPVYPGRMNVDLLTVSAHKIYGPKGAGALFVRKGISISPIFYGGLQEGGLRAGTENVPAIVGFGKAVEVAMDEMKDNYERCKKLSELLLSRIMEEIPGVNFNGDPENRLPTTLNFSFYGVEGESIVLNLDLEGIAVSTGSACSVGSIEPSHVLLAMGLPEDLARSAVRFSIGRDTTEEDILFTVQVLRDVIAKLREISPSYRMQKGAL